MDDIGKFLEANGFYKRGDNMFENAHCHVTILNDCYEITDYEDDGIMYSRDLNIYWLIGMLTYYGYMKKEYIVNIDEKTIQ